MTHEGTQILTISPSSAMMIMKNESLGVAAPSGESDSGDPRYVELDLVEGVASEQIRTNQIELMSLGSIVGDGVRQFHIVFFGLAISLMLSFRTLGVF